MYLISIYFDEKTERKIRGYIGKIAEKTGNGFMIDNHVPPHITVAAIETKHADMVMQGLEEMDRKAGSIQFVSVGSFVPQVLYLEPVLNAYLHELSEKVTAVVEGIPETIIRPYYQPFGWLPHCTLGKQLDKEQMLEAFGVMQSCFAPFEGKVSRIGLAETNPHRDIKVWGMEQTLLNDD